MMTSGDREHENLDEALMRLMRGMHTMTGPGIARDDKVLDGLGEGMYPVAMQAMTSVETCMRGGGEERRDAAPR
jgi:hypothetical protein